MKKTIHFLFLFLFLQTAKAQTTDSFVEVVVSDTVQLLPDDIRYTIYVYEEAEIEQILEKSGSKMPKKQEIPPAEELRNLIRARKIDTLPVHLYTTQNERYNVVRRNIFVLHFTSLAQLNSFSDEIQKIKSITAFISQKSSLTEPTARESLMKKLLKKSKLEAGFMAQASGKKLGELLQVKDIPLKEDESTGWTMYPPMSGILNMEYGNGSEVIVIKRTLTVRYSW